MAREREREREVDGGGIIDTMCSAAPCYHPNQANADRQNCSSCLETESNIFFFFFAAKNKTKKQP